MPIKDKDGTVLKLRGPNPAMESQEIWDTSKISLINMKWETINVNSGINIISLDSIPKKESELNQENMIVIPAVKVVEQPIVPVKSPEPIITIQEPIKELPKVVVAPPPLPTTIPEPIKEEVNSNVSELVSKRKRLFHCLPAENVSDDLYGTSRKVFRNKFSFEGLLIKEEDFEMSFWFDRQIETGSIVYPMTTSRRWWKVVASMNRADGYIMECMTSDINPDFT